MEIHFSDFWYYHLKCSWCLFPLKTCKGNILCTLIFHENLPVKYTNVYISSVLQPHRELATQNMHDTSLITNGWMNRPKLLQALQLFLSCGLPTGALHPNFKIKTFL